MDSSDIYIPDDVWKEILTKLVDFRTCVSVYLTCAKFKTLIKDHLTIIERNKDLLCSLTGPDKSGKTTLLAKLGLLRGLFKPKQDDASLFDTLRDYTRTQSSRSSYIKCIFPLDDILQRTVGIYDFKLNDLCWKIRKNHVDVTIYVITFDQIVKDTIRRLTSVLNIMRVNQCSQILVVVSHMDTAKTHQEDYKNILRKYTEVYEEYKQYWPQLQMKIVPVDSLTGWNILPRSLNLENSNTNNTNNSNTNVLDDYEGLSFWETLQRFHTDGYQIDRPYRVFSTENPLHYKFPAYLMAGVLRVGDHLINSEVKLEITNILVNEKSVKLTYAQAPPLYLRLKGAIPRRSNWPRVYGPNLRNTSCVIARMIFLQTIDRTVLNDVKFETCYDGVRRLTSFAVLEYLNAITYQPVDRQDHEKLDNYIFSNEVLVAEVSLMDPVCIDQESQYPDFSRFYITGKSTSRSSGVVAIGVVISADWNNQTK